MNKIQVTRLKAKVLDIVSVLDKELSTVFTKISRRKQISKKVIFMMLIKF